MMNPFLTQLNEKNLCTWFILPLLDLGVDAFGRANLVNSFLIENERKILVSVLDANLCLPVQEHSCFLSMQVRGGVEALIFEIPTVWEQDYQKFLAGRYSKLSDLAKERIRKKSGLKYLSPDGKGNKITDAILMALDLHPALREKWLEILGPSTSSYLPEELLSVPRPECFITIER